MNSVTLVGRVQGDPVYHCTVEARDLTRFTVATPAINRRGNTRRLPAVPLPATYAEPGGSGCEAQWSPPTVVEDAPPRPAAAPVVHHCLAWGPAALDLHAHLKVGDRVMVRGELRYRCDRRVEIVVRQYTYL